jgi:hypothetical protein
VTISLRESTPMSELLGVIDADEADPLAAQFIASLQARGLRIPDDVRAQLENGASPAE